VYLLDTNVLLEFRRIDAGRGDAAVAAWARAQDPAALFLSALTIMEVERGILLAERRDPAQAGALRRWMTGLVLPAFRGRVLPLDAEVARTAARLHVPDPRPLADSLIAATAITHGLALATRNLRDFAMPELAVVNPWDN
jgi:hypothetical protein